MERAAVLNVFGKWAKKVLKTGLECRRPILLLTAAAAAGRSFQTRAPATEKARRPTVGSLTAGTNRSSEVEDRSLCRVGMLATGVNCRRY